MAKEYHRARFDQMTQAVNVFSAIDTQADGTAAVITVPQGVRRIKKVRVGFALSTETATDSGGVIALRLAGDGLIDGQQDLVPLGVSSIAQGTPATGLVVIQPAIEMEVDLAVIPGNTIQLSGAYTGVDFGTPEIGVELVFE